MLNNIDLEALLTERVNQVNLKSIAFAQLDNVLAANAQDITFLGGFEQNEITPLFDRFEFHIDRRHGGAIIRTRIGLYVQNPHWLENLEPIGYYELETSEEGEILDDWFVIEKEKYVKDIGIISHLQHLNASLPLAYLKRNHIAYEFVTYISLIGTCFVSRQFESVNQFICRANTYLETNDVSKLDVAYLKKCREFLKLMSNYLIANKLITDYTVKESAGNRNRE